MNPDAYITILQDVSPEEGINWQQLKEYNIIMREKFFFASPSLDELQKAKENNIKFFYSVPIREAYVLNSFINFGVSAAIVAGTLGHQLDYLKNVPIEIRMTPNDGKDVLDYKPLYGSWFRPEDFYLLEEVDVCEFTTTSLKQEQALFRIYAEQHEWPGELSYIIKGITDNSVMNRMIPPEFQERRNNCRMKCQTGYLCSWCDTIAYLAVPSRIKSIMKDNNE